MTRDKSAIAERPLAGALATVSVCMATYNGQQYLQAQIDSILHQLGPHDELLVSDDGSTDGTLAVLGSYGDRIRLVAQCRAGVVKNFERALAAARGDIVVLSDQDDVWLEGKIALVRERLGNNTLLMMNGIVVDSALAPVGKDVFEFVDFRNGFFRNFVRPRYVGCCLAFRRELLDIALPFPSRISWHDWYLSLVAELLFEPAFDQTRTILFRRHRDNASSTGQGSRNSLVVKIRMRLWMARAVCIAVWRRTRRRV